MTETLRNLGTGNWKKKVEEKHSNMADTAGGAIENDDEAEQ